MVTMKQIKVGKVFNGVYQVGKPLYYFALVGFLIMNPLLDLQIQDVEFYIMCKTPSRAL